MADGPARGSAVSVRSLRLVPYWSVHETLGVDAHNAPLKMRTRRIHLYRAVAWSCVRRHPVAGAALGSTDVEGSDPPSRGLGTGAGQACFHTLVPAPRGVAPFQISLAGRQTRRPYLRPWANEVAVRASIAVLRAGHESRPSAGAVLVTPAWSLALHSSPFAATQTALMRVRREEPTK